MINIAKNYLPANSEHLFLKRKKNIQASSMIIKPILHHRIENSSPRSIMCQEFFEKRIMRKVIRHTSMHYGREIYLDFMQSEI